MFGLTGNEGNHGEDVKEYYFYLDSTPTHSYMKFLYKYPHAAYPYEELIRENGQRGKQQPEYELLDTGIFEEDRYFDVLVEYAKGDVEDMLIRITATNRGPEQAELHLLPTLWFRNTWSWAESSKRPELQAFPASGDRKIIGARTVDRDPMWLYCQGSPELLFTENETNTQRLYQSGSQSYVKDGINDYIVQGDGRAVNPAKRGTKAAAHYHGNVGAGQSLTIHLRLTNKEHLTEDFGPSFQQVFATRIQEADEYYATIIPGGLPEDGKNVMRQALSGLLWSKQFYHYVVRDWLSGDPAQPKPPQERLGGRNAKWAHLFNADVISMPDKWEYPWYASWDLAFHCVALSLVDSDFAKDQLQLLLREWYMHPSGQIPAYEWALGDVNPPVHAWAALRVYKIEKRRRVVGDLAFLESVFHKLLLNFTWWVNRKDAEGMNVFEGGFLGLDNIGVFDRSAPLPTGGHLEQSDGTSWMAMYTLNLLAIAAELATHNPAYENVASKFWEHFLHIANAMSHLGESDTGLWDEADGFFYDLLHTPDEQRTRIKVRSMVGLVPLFAVETLEDESIANMPGFARRMNWFIANRPDLTGEVACMRTPGEGERRLLSVVNEKQLRSILSVMLDESEFLSPYGVRALSQVHKQHPFVLQVNDREHSVAYEPGESQSALFGGNSNWRGPVWFPMNYLLIESLQKFHHYYGDRFTVECPTGSGRMMTLHEVAALLSQRLSSIFLRNGEGRRPVYGNVDTFQSDPHWKDLLLFFEYFHGDDGSGVGASHQTGWTGLVAKLLQQSGTPEDGEKSVRTPGSLTARRHLMMSGGGRQS